MRTHSPLDMATLGLAALLLRALPGVLSRGRVARRLRDYPASENWLWLRSLGRRFHVDLPLDLNLDVAREQGVELDAGPNVIDPEQRAAFLRDGYLRPFRVLDAAQASELCAEVQRAADEPGVYGFASPRDLHLQHPSVRALLRRPAIVERLAQLMGPDLGVWRSELFAKQPGAGAIMTHHATVYRFEDRAPVLEPTRSEGLFQLTVWIALTDAHRDNGCMYVIPGTHTRPVSFRRGGARRFYGFDPVVVDPEIHVEPKAVELSAGEAFIFSERVLHGSFANDSDRPRVALNARVIEPDVGVHAGKEKHLALHHDATFDLNAWGVWQLAGTDPHGQNPHVHFPEDA